jgi:hypothetical protein
MYRKDYRIAFDAFERSRVCMYLQIEQNYFRKFNSSFIIVQGRAVRFGEVSGEFTGKLSTKRMFYGCLLKRKTTRRVALCGMLAAASKQQQANVVASCMADIERLLARYDSPKKQRAVLQMSIGEARK